MGPTEPRVAKLLLDENRHAQHPKGDRHEERPLPEDLAHRSHVETPDTTRDPSDEEDNRDEGYGDQPQGKEIALMLGTQPVGGLLGSRRTTGHRHFCCRFAPT